MKQNVEWVLSVLALITAIGALLFGAWLYPTDPRFPTVGAACIAFALWLVIGLKPRR